MKLIEKEELGTLVPHKGKMFLLDRITDWDAESWTIRSETKIDRSFMFYDEQAGGAPNYALFEVAAQTVAALTGLFAREHSLPPNMGFILSVTNMHFDSAVIPCGAVVSAAATRESAVQNVFSFSVSFSVDGTPFGQGKLTVLEAAS